LSCGSGNGQQDCKCSETKNNEAVLFLGGVIIASLGLLWWASIPAAVAAVITAGGIGISVYGRYLSDKWPKECDDPKFCKCTDPWREPQDVKYDPLTIDLNRDGSTNLTNSAYFDLDVNGFAEAAKWVNSDDGLLALDRNGDGKINDGSELFGDHTVKSDGTFATDGFNALADLDSNGNGVIDEMTLRSPSFAC
jgi:hypothetical protein